MNLLSLNVEWHPWAPVGPIDKSDLQAYPESYQLLNMKEVSKLYSNGGYSGYTEYIRPNKGETYFISPIQQAFQQALFSSKWWARRNIDIRSGESNKTFEY